MSYIDAVLWTPKDDGDDESVEDKVYVWVRDENGVLDIEPYTAPYSCFYEDPHGDHQSIFPDRPALTLKTFSNKFRTRGEMVNDKWRGPGWQKARWVKKDWIESYKKPPKDGDLNFLPPPLYESDVEPEFKILAAKYYQKAPPPIQTTFFDIEVDAPELEKTGWPSPTKPFGEINAISLNHMWKQESVLITVLPPGFQGPKPTEKEVGCDRIRWADDEEQLLYYFFQEIEESDVLSGWNSDNFDIPYVVARQKEHEKNTGKKPTHKEFIDIMEENATIHLCRGGLSARPKKVKKLYSTEKQRLWQLKGRVSLDYMLVYKKFTFVPQSSFSLENISIFEKVGTKLPYKGTLPALYRNDYLTFLRYNVHDTNLLRDLDLSLNFMKLVNDMAHDCCCKLNDVLGTVLLTDQAMMAHAWHQREQSQHIPDRGSNLEVPTYKSWIHSKAGRAEKLKQGKKIVDGEEDDNKEQFVGAYVHELTNEERSLYNKGLHDYTGSIDLKSLYPRTIIALNISPETVKANAIDGQDIIWDKKMQWEGLSHPDPAGEEGKAPNVWGARKDIVGIVPEVLSYWFDQRVEQQAAMEKAIEAGDKELAAHYKRLQHIKKIQLNSAYGALGNSYSHFFMLALAESCTLGGQGIMKHMMGYVGEILDGEESIWANSIIYGDTDSCYFKLPYVENNEEAIALADAVTLKVNETFVPYMLKTHNCVEEEAQKVLAEREIVADRSLFVEKKKYALHVIDDSGKPTDYIKVMGLDVKQSSTPKVIQTFLWEVLSALLEKGLSEEEIAEIIHDFRKKFYEDLTVEEIGMPKTVNKLGDYKDRIYIRGLLAQQEKSQSTFSDVEPLTLDELMYLERAEREGKKILDPKSKKNRWEQITGTTAVPGHVQASINWNEWLGRRNDKVFSPVVDGMKIRIYYLIDGDLGNPENYRSISIPTDAPFMPDWFEELPFDMQVMSEKLIDAKIGSMYKSIGWKVPKEGTDVRELAGLLEF